jgi:hypothetical protein
MRWLRAYVAMLPRLQAERALLAVATGQAADSWAAVDARRGLIRAWERDAAPPVEQRAKPTKDEFLRNMAALGFSVEA